MTRHDSLRICAHSSRSSTRTVTLNGTRVRRRWPAISIRQSSLFSVKKMRRRSAVGVMPANAPATSRWRSRPSIADRVERRALLVARAEVDRAAVLREEIALHRLGRRDVSATARSIDAVDIRRRQRRRRLILPAAPALRRAPGHRRHPRLAPAPPRRGAAAARPCARRIRSRTSGSFGSSVEPRQRHREQLRDAVVAIGHEDHARAVGRDRALRVAPRIRVTFSSRFVSISTGTTSAF